jgi:hypothetical protein
MSDSHKHGRRGGGWLPKRDADAEAIAEWERQRDALAALHERQGEQLDLFDGDAA